MWHLELPEMKAEAVVVALFDFPIILWVRKLRGPQRETSQRGMSEMGSCSESRIQHVNSHCSF